MVLALLQWRFDTLCLGRFSARCALGAFAVFAVSHISPIPLRQIFTFLVSSLRRTLVILSFLLSPMRRLFGLLLLLLRVQLWILFDAFLLLVILSLALRTFPHASPVVVFTFRFLAVLSPVLRVAGDNMVLQSVVGRGVLSQLPEVCGALAASSQELVKVRTPPWEFGIVVLDGSIEIVVRFLLLLVKDPAVLRVFVRVTF
jgi:hypothetical protein